MSVESSSKIMLGIGDSAASVTEGSVLRAMALGSCIALMILDRKTRCVAMAHMALPDSFIAPDRGLVQPGYFVDTGVPALLDRMRHVGGSLSKPSNLIVKIAGGASIADPNNTFNIGKRNVLAAKRVLWQLGLATMAEDVGGNHSRTVSLFRDTGRIVLSCPGRPDWEL